MDATVKLTGFEVAGIDGNDVPLSRLLAHFPAVVLKARTRAVARPARQRLRA
jgi:hypothetical protein